MLTILFMLLGCETISPFVGEELKASVCDRDHDGLGRSSDFCGGDDCDDADNAIGAPSGWYRDVDLDTYGAGEEEFSCSQPEGFVIVTGDCDDTDELVSPAGIESCNSVDDDCDGEIDEENITVWYLDADQDSYGNVDIYLVQCDEPVGYVDNAQDCDDLVATINPDGTEICDNGIDEDCNDLTDDAEGSQIWYADADQDSYGDPQTALYSCTESVEGYVLDSNDCDDTNLDVNPSANEACRDEVDNDCDGEVDTDAVDVAWYADVDQDGYGNVNVTTTDCAPPEGYVGNSEDCDDESRDVNPGVEETCNNGIDDNCDESPGECDLSGTSTLASADISVEGDNDFTGWTIPEDCDIDGNGQADLIITAPYDSVDAESTGSTFVLLNSSLTGSTLTTTAADVTIVGEAERDFSGSALACGDVDGDGLNELLVGTPGSDEAGSDIGAVFLLLGSRLSGTMNLSDVESVWSGTENEHSFGERALAIADVDGNGSGDLIMGSPLNSVIDASAGALYVISGDTIPSERTSVTQADATWTGETAGDYAGNSVASCDMDGDGLSDLFVGAYLRDEPEADAGVVYFLWGDTTFASNGLENSDARWTGESSGDNAGKSISCRGDVNGDGTRDLLISAAEDDDGADNAGAVYLLLGDAFSGTESLTGADAKWIGETAQDQMGNAVTMCDNDNNGLSEILFSSTEYNGSSSNLGIVYLVDGGTHSGTASASSANAVWTGESGSDQAGSALACLGQVDEDDMEDIAIGASAGSTAYLIYGLGY